MNLQCITFIVCFIQNDLYLNKASIKLQQEYKNSMPASSYQQQKLRVCEICSAYLGIHDNDRRLADHFGGKLHLGFITIRDKLAELKVNVTPCSQIDFPNYSYILNHY